MPAAHFKILLTTFKALNGLAPNYIKDLLTPSAPRRSLRSVDAALLVVPRSQFVTKHSQALTEHPACGRLPVQATSLASFKSLLKASLHRKAFMNI